MIVDKIKLLTNAFKIKGSFSNVVIFKIITVNYTIKIINCKENQLKVQ